ncbi:MAG: RHS repeat-associated core domain-containing protein, partial [Cellulomonadaceae bacterium]|nr:RHS repeat-associated core domain-containing protein [Cellulomonadaceae bacterium]
LVTDTPVATITRFGYAGEYTDPTGLIYLRARYYDPTSAQFLSIDALVSETAAPYGYADGNPLQLTDPLGLSWYNPASWTAQTWDNISAVAGVASWALTFTGVGAPVAGLLAGVSVVTGLRASQMHYSEGDKLEAFMSGASALVGVVGAGVDLARLASPVLTGTRTALRAPRLVRDGIEVLDGSGALMDAGALHAQVLCGVVELFV